MGKLVQVCAQVFNPGMPRFCCAPPDHTEGPEPTDHIVIFEGRTYRYPVTAEENTHG